MPSLAAIWSAVRTPMLRMSRANRNGFSEISGTIDKTELIRVHAGIFFALVEAMDEGHCGLPGEELVPPHRKAA
jgi:hypothetical protein